ncbi:MAG: hypothetical protein ACPKPY_05205 [Nitrososphaeraceae archaeon]
MNKDEKEVNKSICEALNCYRKSTKKIRINVGKFGEIILSTCESCSSKFVEKHEIN